MDTDSPAVRMRVTVLGTILVASCNGLDLRDEQALAGANAQSGTAGLPSATEGSTSSGDEPPADEPAAPLKFDVASPDAQPETICSTPPDFDDDGDGFTEADGDCNDCDPNANPGAIEVATAPNGAAVDEDCDGAIDNPPIVCDGGLDLSDPDPRDAAAAIGLCKDWTEANPWGVQSVQYVRADGTPANSTPQNGIMDFFGNVVVPQEGDQLLVLSTGRARTPFDIDPCNTDSCSIGTSGTAPSGFPQDVPLCAGGSDIHDDIALEVTLVAPSNAIGYAFDFSFFSFEYPEWVCTEYNDQFIALVDPAPVGSVNGNISFDAMTNPVSVNIAFFEVCTGCPLGVDELGGTGFDVWDDAGGTGWLETTAPVEGGSEVTVRFALWDTGDASWDSTVLIDNFRWIANGGTVSVGTTPAG